MDTYNNDAVSESHLDEIEISNKSHMDAKRSVLGRLKHGDKDLREIAIKELIDNDSFWDSVMSIGDNLSLDRDELLTDSINIGVSVFVSVAEEVYNLSLKMEKESQQ